MTLRPWRQRSKRLDHDLQERVRNLERELDWVRGEREEAQAAVAHERREAATRMRELEASSNRLKSARKDDLKRVTRERAQALERCKVSLPLLPLGLKVISTPSHEMSPWNPLFVE